VPELTIWLELVKKVKPDVVKAAQMLDSWLGPDGIAGGAISEKTPLSIGAEPTTTIYEIEEIQDSEDSGDNEDNSEDVGALQSQASRKSHIPIPQLRQLTLLELFHPI
jgi:hypothetical protein